MRNIFACKEFWLALPDESCYEIEVQGTKAFVIGAGAAYREGDGPQAVQISHAVIGEAGRDPLFQGDRH